jgi:hypothetical protein
VGEPAVAGHPTVRGVPSADPPPSPHKIMEVENMEKKEKILKEEEYELEERAGLYDLEREDFVYPPSLDIKFKIDVIPANKWTRYAGITLTELEHAEDGLPEAIKAVEEKRQRFMEQHELYEFYIFYKNQRIFVGKYFVKKTQSPP